MSQSLKLYSAWFCPFAQRVRCALEQKAVPHELLDVDPYDKSQRWLAVNPLGLVPAIVHDGRSVWESSVCLEYVNEAFRGIGPDLLPDDAYLRAKHRMMGDHITKRLLPPFYALLQRETDDERATAAGELTAAFGHFEREMAPGPGAYFTGGGHMQYADHMLAPFALRVAPVLRHYRGFELPATMARYHRWLSAVSGCEHVRACMPSDGDIQRVYQRYADNTARTLVADAVRLGTALP